MLEKQIEAIRNQSIPVKSEDIHVWYNKCDVVQYHPVDKNIRTYVCNWNTKFFGRFAIPLLVKTPYVAVFDDDIIPQKDWLKNCIETIEKPESNGILGGSGVVIFGRAYYPFDKIGWNGIHSDKAERVDLVGHAWFFRQEWAKYLWYEKPFSWDNGEDIMFSYLAQKHGGVDTFVPPHPEGDTNLWCTDFNTSNEVGNDANASWLKTSHIPERDGICVYCLDNGWKTVKGVK
jgi:hypothetical protein